MARAFSGAFIACNDAHVSGPTTAFSVALWVKGIAQDAEVYSESASGSTNQFLQMRGDTGATGKLGLIMRSDAGGAGSPTHASTATIFNSLWHHVVVTQDISSNWIVYVDGALDISGTRSSTELGTTTLNQATIGAFRGGGSTAVAFSGSIAHVANWSRQLSAAEAATLAKGWLPSVFGPDHYWPLGGRDSPEPDNGAAVAVNGVLSLTTRADGPVMTDTPTFLSSWGRRPVPMIAGPDIDHIFGLRGRNK
jgi:hypothetical protein